MRLTAMQAGVSWTNLRPRPHHTVDAELATVTPANPSRSVFDVFDAFIVDLSHAWVHVRCQLLGILKTVLEKWARSLEGALCEI